MQGPVSAWERARRLHAKYCGVILLDLYAYIYVLVWGEFLFCENGVLAECGAARSVQTLPAPGGVLSVRLVLGAWDWLATAHVT